MTRQDDNRGSRVTARQDPDDIDRQLPSFRRRKPVTFWVVIIAVAAMVLSLVALPLAILLS